MTSIPSGLLDAASRHLGTAVHAVRPLSGGYESFVARLRAGDADVVVHVSPPWRTQAELAWVHDVVAHVHRAVPEAIPPIAGRSGTVFDWDGRWAALYPFTEGEPVRRGDGPLTRAAARLLARIHLALGQVTVPARPPVAEHFGGSTPNSSELHDPELDAWFASLGDGALTVGLTHGDFYGANLLARGGAIVGVIDWHDAARQPLALEVAGASFELCRDASHVLDGAAAAEFVETYRAGGGPLGERELALIPTLRAWWVREDARRALALGAEGDPEYARHQVAAFRALRVAR